MGPEYNHKCPPHKKELEGGHTEGREDDVTIEAETGVCGHKPSDRQQPP